ncbi:hypothetical protein KXV25_001538 [Aspergillus fumigatus]|nr:hypothetical protein KXW32_006538 [Aspergillus fumigatus]KAH2585641.1 hypothetical protein KXV99_003657 [Aspergillus fumigatus]KAH2984036.1 hypothetical protein KXV25_001538 [Aspergillus fumigatus]
MYIRSTLLPILGFSATGMAAYVLEDDYGTSTSFFDTFSFFTDPDQTAASSHHTNVAGSSGRQSVRLTSTKSYTHGLIILDLEHMPGGICGTWPAFWMLGPDWPSHGEIDIIEGVNTQPVNQMTLHSTDGCSIANGGFTGTLLTSNCYDYAPSQDTNAGCGIAATSSRTYGTGFNNAGGGIYATEWTSAGISIWFFPRGSTPTDIRAGTPNPTNWGPPLAKFAPGSCSFDAHFSEMQIVFDTTFCGGWAGSVWGSGSCASVAPSCQDFVANNPSAFREAYWLIESLKVYQDAPGESNNMRMNATSHLNVQLPRKGGRRSPGLHGRGFLEGTGKW